MTRANRILNQLNEGPRRGMGDLDITSHVLQGDDIPPAIRDIAHSVFDEKDNWEVNLTLVKYHQVYDTMKNVRLGDANDLIQDSY